ncbi:DNA primase [Azospirillum sp. RWY-5-1]|uniref:DNA primase n=1 Tax=Azospirillum oleiclasticum TaxID=2735135 RepID=A0ABX2TEV4_9PROT|nr:toprim domain-containing protein [Azospirillum oleiclasticum]NYZ16894.1 DNA primase [Azospirillum oleiclasticum]NYZ21831.1 DNA primase [Azospirillum oleiclasticum]
MSAASEMAQRLAREAEAVCRHYLPLGRRQGRYWRVGDVHGTPGESLYVRLQGGAVGRWADAATGEHGDLLDLIGLNRGLDRLAAVLDEARVFLGSPRAPTEPRWEPPAPVGSPGAARCLFARSRPLAGTLAEAYLRNRGFTNVRTLGCLRFQPRCWYRDGGDGLARGPALIAAVTGLDGGLTGVQRTWLDPSGGGKAAMSSPRRALGYLLGNGVRFGVARDVLAAGEGVETMLALRTALPALPMVAALSAGHLAALCLPPTLRRLYVARDNDAAGRRAVERLGRRAEALGIEALVLAPVLGDLNDDLLAFGQAALRAHLRAQLAPEDVARFRMGGGRRWGA